MSVSAPRLHVCVLRRLHLIKALRLPPIHTLLARDGGVVPARPVAGLHVFGKTPYNYKYLCMNPTYLDYLGGRELRVAQW